MRVAAAPPRVNIEFREASAPRGIPGISNESFDRAVEVEMRRMEEERAASYIQRAYRGCLGRRMYKKMRQAHRENKAILMIQNAWRSRCARKVLNIARQQNYKKKCAIMIQKHIRGYLGRKLKLARTRILLKAW